MRIQEYLKLFICYFSLEVYVLITELYISYVGKFLIYSFGAGAHRGRPGRVGERDGGGGHVQSCWTGHTNHTPRKRKPN